MGASRRSPRRDVHAAVTRVGVQCSGSSRHCASTAGARGGEGVLPRLDLGLPLLRGVETGDRGVSSLLPENLLGPPVPARF